MHPLRRLALGGLWGAVGPVSVALLVIAIWGDWILGHTGRMFADGSPITFPLTFAYNVLDLWFLLPLEAGFGMIFGATRVAVCASNPRFEAKLGAVIWAVMGLPFFLVGLGLATLIFALETAMARGPVERSYFMEVLFPVSGIYLAHIGGGAIAGFQVNYFLAATFGSADEGLPL